MIEDGVVFPWRAEDHVDVRCRGAQAWYFHRFYEFQPDLDTSNPLVQAEILKIMGFWTQLGVSGFRMDAVPFVIAEKGADQPHPKPQYGMLRQFRELLQWRQGDSVILGEANVKPAIDLQYFGDDGDRLQMMFNFHVNQHLFYALASSDTQPLIDAMEATRERPATAQWGHFLRNHDELDLGRLSTKQRQVVFDAFAPDKERAALRPRHPAPARADARRRSAPPRARVQPDADAAWHAGAALRRRDRDGRRSRPARAQLRAHRDAVVDGAERRLHDRRALRRAGHLGRPVRLRTRQRRGAADATRESFLNWLERMCRMRKEFPEIGWGDFESMTSSDPAVMVLRYEWRNNAVLFVHNFAGEPREVRFASGDDRRGSGLLVNVLTEDHSRADAKGRHVVLVEPYGYRWYRVGGLDYILRRSEA